MKLKWRRKIHSYEARWNGFTIVVYSGFDCWNYYVSDLPFLSKDKTYKTSTEAKNAAKATLEQFLIECNDFMQEL
jgi:hypothetical protein